MGVTSLLLACRYFNLTQPVRVATIGENKHEKYHQYFNLTQPVRVATANLYKRSNKLSCILYSVCLFFLTKQYGQILLTAMESYPFFIIFGAKRPAKLCSLIIRTGSKQKYRHLIMRWRYVDFECLFAFIFGMYSVCLLCSRLQVFFFQTPSSK